MAQKERIIELQRQLKIARDALTYIQAGHGCASALAEDALDKMMPLDKKYPIQGVVGHERRPRT